MGHAAARSTCANFSTAKVYSASVLADVVNTRPTNHRDATSIAPHRTTTDPMQVASLRQRHHVLDGGHRSHPGV